MKSQIARLPNLHVDRFSGLYLWAAFIIVFAITIPDSFLTMSTVHQIASSQAINGIVAIAVLIPLTAGEFDLSVGANANMTSLIAIVLINDHVGLGVAILAALGAGLLVGLANAFVITKLGVNSFIGTLGMGSILAALQTIVTSNVLPGFPISSAWTNLTQTTIGGFQVVIVYLIVVAILAWWLLDHMPAGRFLYAVGSNREASRLAGIRVERWTVFSLALSGLLAGVAGVLYGSLTGPSLSFGGTLLLPAFAATFLGSTQLYPGKFNVWGTIIAIFVLATGVQGFQLLSGVQWLSSMFNGVALIVAVAMSVNWRKRSGRQPTTPGDEDDQEAEPGLTDRPRVSLSDSAGGGAAAT